MNQNTPYKIYLYDTDTDCIGSGSLSSSYIQWQLQEAAGQDVEVHISSVGGSAFGQRRKPIHRFKFKHELRNAAINSINSRRNNYSNNLRRLIRSIIMASRNGLNPKIRGPKGATFGRALPAAFGFGNGIKPDGIDDYLQIPSLTGMAIPHLWTIEFWVYMDTPMPSFQGWIEIHDNSGSGEMRLQGQPDDQTNDFQFICNTGGIVMGSSTPGKCIRGSKNHIVLTFDIDASITNCILNGNIFTKVSGPVSKIIDPYLGTFQLFNLFVLSSQGLYSNKLVDEFRMYSEVLSNDDITTNYNQGMGGNPCKTENLFVWYNFEKFENLDFSKLQDGSDMRLGIRDLSLKNNHAQAYNMDTNPLSDTYALEPF